MIDVESYFLPYNRLKDSFKNFGFFLYYINSFDRVKHLYQLDYHNTDDWIRKLDEYNVALERRDEIVDVLFSYNKEFNSFDKVRMNIEKLRKKNCFVVVTGQQPGLLTSPLYNIYKAITTIKLAKHLSEKYDHDFVPLFWIGSDDSDIDEVNSINFETDEGRILTFRLPLYHDGKSISDYQIDNKIEGIVDDIFKNMRQTEFTDIVKRLILSDTTSIQNNFRKIMSDLFKEFGLIFIEPRKLRKLTYPLLQKAVLQRREINNAIQQVEQDYINVNSKLSIDVSHDMTMLFYYNNLSRNKITTIDDERFYSDKGISWSKEELIEEIAKKPEKFSTNVVLRPVVQDNIFPTCAYVGGPGEVKYFGQLNNVYKLFDMKMPAIFPRASVTLLEKKYNRLREKFDIDYTELVDGSFTRLFFRETEHSIHIDKLLAEVNNSLMLIKDEADKKGKAVSSSLNSSFNKVESELKKIREKYIKRLEEMEGQSKQQLNRLQNVIIPKCKPQERIYNIVYYLNFYGTDFIKVLMKEINIFSFKNQLIRIL